MPSTVRKNLPNLQLPLRLSDKHFRQTSKFAYSITPIQREQYISESPVACRLQNNNFTTCIPTYLQGMMLSNWLHRQTCRVHVEKK